MSKFVPVIALHGGAGTILKANMTPEKEAAYHAGLRECLQAGLDVLRKGQSYRRCHGICNCSGRKSAFNAGRGAVFTADETHEMDAAIMDGTTRACGAISGICRPRNPILAARAVMEQTEHVFAGEGAKRFCEAAGLEMMAPDWFSTEQRRKALHDEMERRRSGAADDGDPARKHGTVGAVALDSLGHLAAATSTGA